MNIQFDLSLNTLVVSGVVIVAGWGVRAVGWALIESIKKLIAQLLQTMARVEVLDSKLQDLTRAVGDHQKLRTDINVFYARLKELEEKFGNGH